MPIRSLTSCLPLAVLAACGSAQAAAVDAGNPFHCSAGFIARSGQLEAAGEEVPEELVSRLMWEALRASGLPEGQRRPGESEALLNRLRGDPEATLALVEACAEQQDQDPTFRAASSAFLESD